MEKVKLEDVLKVGQAVVCAKPGDRHGAIGVIKGLKKSTFRVSWKLSPQGVPYPAEKSSSFAHTALAPRLLDYVEGVPQSHGGVAFIFPMEMACDIDALVEAHRADAETQKMAVQTNFFMIGGVHGDIRYNINDRNCPKAPPCKKYLEFDDALADAKEMAAQYDDSYVVLAVAAVVKPKSAVKAKEEVDVTVHQSMLLENKAEDS